MGRSGQLERVKEVAEAVVDGRFEETLWTLGSFTLWSKGLFRLPGDRVLRTSYGHGILSPFWPGRKRDIRYRPFADV